MDALRSDRKMIAAETLGDCEIESVRGDVVVLRPLGANPLTGETIARYRSAIEAAASRVLGGGVRVAMSGETLPEATPVPRRAEPAPAAPQAVETGSPASRPPEEPRPAPRAQAEQKPQRLSASGARAERTKALRGKDPALDSAMDALDLELLE
jgi:hypothetical protein